MIQDAELRSYRGVKCLYCRQPIPVSALIAGVDGEAKEKHATPLEHRCQVFHLRCLVCGKEKPYKMGEILEFQGSPATLRVATKAAHLPADRSTSANG